MEEAFHDLVWHKEERYWVVYLQVIGLVGRRRAMTLASHHIFGSLDVRKHTEQKDHNYSVALLL